MTRLLEPRWQVRFSWMLLGASVVGWPASALTVASGEPQFILGLSWLALIISSYTTLVAAHGNRLVEDQDNDGQ